MTSAKYSLSIESLAVGTAVGDSGEIGYGDFEKGMVSVPAGSSLTLLTWHSSVTGDPNGTYLPAFSSAAVPAAITQTVSAGKSYPIPVDLFGARFLKITGNATGVVGVTLKD
jgi:hypothetical protein